MPGQVREVRVCGDLFGGANCKVYGVGWQICPVAVFSDGFGLKKGKVAGEGGGGLFPMGVEARVFYNGDEFRRHFTKRQVGLPC